MPDHRLHVPVAWLIAAAYLLVLIALAFWPFGGGAVDGRTNLEPLETIGRALRRGPASGQFRLLIGNIVAFVPLGLLLPIVAPRARSLAAVFLAALALSAAIELGQLAVSLMIGFAYRSTDVDDIILNVLGAVIGYGAFRVVTYRAHPDSH